MSDFWSSWRVYKSSFLSLTAWWDAGKARLKQYIREFSKKKAVSYRKLITSLEHTLFHLNRRLLNGDEVLPIIEDVESELEAAHRDVERGARIRANVQWAKEGEASTKYLLGLERKRDQRRIFTSVKNMAGTVVSAFVGIAWAWVAFYGSLFTSQSLDRIEQDFFLNSLSLKLSRVEQSLCEEDLIEGECKRALDAMATGKSPGLDGLPAEFYQRFWSLLGTDFVDVINFAYNHGQLSPSQRSGVITLIHYYYYYYELYFNTVQFHLY